VADAWNETSGTQVRPVTGGPEAAGRLSVEVAQALLVELDPISLECLRKGSQSHSCDQRATISGCEGRFSRVSAFS